MEFTNKALQTQIVSFFGKIFDYSTEWQNTDKSVEKNDYILKQLWDNYGIKRRNIGNDLVLLNYSKTHEKYDRNNLITRLCRHLILDMNSMSIRSLGVTKNNNTDEETLQQMDYSNCVIQQFRVGTMIVFNPLLSQDERFNDDNTIENDEGNVNVEISTRNKLGTSNYNTNVNFKEYFNYNNYNNNIQTDSFPSEYCYVFNCENVNEHITNENINTLVACYKFKSIPDSLVTYYKIMESPTEENIKAHCEGMVNCITLDSIKDVILESGGGNVHIPETYKFTTFDEANNYLTTTSNYFQGFMIYDSNHNRYKIINPRYMELKHLRGDLPLNTNFENRENLFKIYWRLIQENNDTKFLQEFDTRGIYVNIFNGFYIEISKFINNLFNLYQNANVKRTMNKADVPKHIGPLCYELHGQFLKSKSITTRDTVKDFIIKQDVGRIYWRVFEPSRHVITE